MWHRVSTFSAVHKTNLDWKWVPYLYRHGDLSPVGLLNYPILYYNFHFTSTSQNIPRFFPLSSMEIEFCIVFMYLEDRCSLNQTVPEVNKSPFGYGEERMVKASFKKIKIKERKTEKKLSLLKSIFQFSITRISSLLLLCLSTELIIRFPISKSKYHQR